LTTSLMCHRWPNAHDRAPGAYVRYRYHRNHYVRGGKTPCSAMQKFNVRYGIRLLCG
jgi:hypothetical protein